ncbi:hypothetical protein SOVF_139240 isoform B [Spinacia oleracea]|nr:hypothetical protein SOVF_139240 isoform B [Spinacia oleracea]
MVIHCLPSKNPYIELKNRFRDMHMENGIPSYYKYGTPDGRWRYDLEIMTTIIELAEECFDDGKIVENINLTGLDHDTKTQMDEDSDDDVVEIENPNPIIPEPTIEISSDTEIEPETNTDEVNNELQQNNEDMEYESDPEEDFDDFEDHEHSLPVCRATPSSDAATSGVVLAPLPMTGATHQNAEEEKTHVLSSVPAPASASASAPAVQPKEAVNLRPPAKLPSRPRKLRKLSPENSESSMKSSNNNNSKIVPRPRLMAAAHHHRSLSLDGEIEIALNHLRTADPNLAKLIDLHQPPTFDSFQTPFLALSKSILYQQLAYKAGTSIYSRFVALCGGESGVVPATVLALTSQQLRQIGVSGRKTSYLHDLARKYQNGILSDSAIVNMDDKSLFTMLTMVNGIGSWSVHMFMIFSLHRPDVLPVNDLGIRKGVQLLYGLQDLPRPSQMDQLCEKWRPYRSVASWYIWRLVEAKGTPTSSVVTLPAAGMSLQPQQHMSPLPSPHQQQQSQQQPHFIDPMNTIINLGQLS